MPIEPITFSKGINTGKSPLVLQDGELVSCSGLSFETMGKLVTRDPLYAVNGTAVGSINGIHRYQNWLLLADAGAFRYKWDLKGYCDLYTPADENFTLLDNIGTGRPRFADMDDFTFIVNGQDRKAFSSAALYDWNIENPTKACTGAVSGTAVTSTTFPYSLYYTFFIKFPNGRTYETAPSPAATVGNLDTNKGIDWTNIGTSTYSGTGVIIWRKLYRYSTGLGEAYFVANIRDNTTTTYTDILPDGTIDDNEILETDAYAPPPEGMVDVTNYLQRIFGIKGNNLYYSEPYLPFAFKGTNSIAVTKSGENMVNCIAWGDQIYLGFPSGWKRLQGSDSDSWAIKNTFAEWGPINTHTTKKTRFGIIFQGYDGIYLFDGTVSKNISTKDLGLSLFTSIEKPKEAHAEFDGEKYWFVYSSTGTTLDKCIIVDFRTYPDSKFYNYDFIPSAFEYHNHTGIKYFGKTDGYQYEERPVPVFKSVGATIDTAQYKFGSSSILFDGTDDYICSPPSQAWTMGAGAFTIDFWVRLSDVSGQQGFFSQWNQTGSSNAAYLTWTQGGGLNFVIASGGNTTVSVPGATWNPTANTWYHIAIIRGWGGVANAWAITINGTQSGNTVTDASEWPSMSDNFDIGRGSIIYLSGWIDEFRIFKGTAKWTANFTPPTTVYSTSANLACDVVLHGEGTDGSTVINNSGHGYETITTSLQTGDRAMQSIVTQKNLKKLFYDIDTKGKDVTVTIYADGTAQSPTYTLNKASRTRSFINLANHQGYHFSLALSCSDASKVEIYEPWGIDYTPFGG